MAKLIYQCDDYDQEISIKLSGDADIFDLFEIYEKMAIAIGHHPNSFKDAILAKREEYKNDK